MKRAALLAAVIFGLLAPLAQALEIEGVSVPPTASVSGQTLSLNGAGLRTVVLLVVPVKAYVASFYAPAPLRTPAAVMASPGPLQLNFTFLQGVGQSQVTQAWQAQFASSVTFTYPGFEKDRDAFIQFFGPLKKGGVETVEIDGTSTRAYDAGTLKGTIQGRNFQKAFLSLWFGTNPVQPSLKTALLGGE